MEFILNNLRNKENISKNSVAQLTSLFEKIDLPKKSTLIDPYSMCSYYYFIEKGLSRTYILSDHKEVTTWFSNEGEMIFTMNYHKNPRFDYVQLIEDSVLYRIGSNQLAKLFETNNELANWSRFSNKQTFIALEIKHQRLITLNAKGRYQLFLEENPQLHNRIGLGQLASYLGMSQVTLSRIRSKENITN